MKLSEHEDLKGLSDREAYQVYKTAVKSFKQENPKAHRKCIFPGFLGGALGTVIGSMLKDIVLDIKGSTPQSLWPIMLCAVIGGGIGGAIVMKRLLLGAQPYFKKIREDYQG